MRIDPILSSVISDLFVNLSAGWLGAVIIVPTFSKRKGLKKLWVLTFNLGASILSLVIAFFIKKT